MINRIPSRRGRARLALLVSLVILAALLGWIGYLFWWASSAESGMTPEFEAASLQRRLDASASLQPSGDDGREAFLELETLLAAAWAEVPNPTGCPQRFGSLSRNAESAGGCDAYVMAVMDHVTSSDGDRLLAAMLDAPRLTVESVEPSGNALAGYCMASVRRAARDGDGVAMIDWLRRTIGVHQRLARLPHGETWSMVTKSERRLADELRASAQAGGFDEQTLLGLLGVIDQMSPHDMRPLLEADREEMLALMQQVYTDNGSGDGSLLPHELDAVKQRHSTSDPEVLKSLEDPDRSLIAILKARFTLPSRSDVEARGNDAFDQLIESLELPLRDRYNKVDDICDSVRHGTGDDYLALRFTMPTYKATVGDDYYRDRSIRQTRLVLGIEVYRLRNGGLPRSLTDLASLLGDDVPTTDAFDNAITYSVNGDDYEVN